MDHAGGTGMTRRKLIVPLLVVTALLSGCAERRSASVAMAPPGGEYQRGSALFGMPDYIPGQGTLYVQPRTVPVGPFLAYDKQGHLISTMYMVPIRDLNAHRDFQNLEVAPGMKPLRVQLYYNDGHPGVAEAHYHVVLWYVLEEQEPK
jgi:hypothetical protein